MQVEIYDERELDPKTLTQEADHEALALIEELGLTRQVNDSGARLAYPQPTAEQGFVLDVLFPKATKLDQYDAGAIPLRVLKEIRSYRAENPDHLLVVRHCPPAEVSDPVLVAYTKRQEPHRDMYALGALGRVTWPDFRLVARWGDALESWDKLCAKASTVATATLSDKLDGIVAECEVMRSRIAKGMRLRQVPNVYLQGMDL